MSGFTVKQTNALKRGLTHLQIRTRVSDGREISYIEGWFAIAEANRIFGFEGWDRETIEAKCIQGREARGCYSVLYTARVRVSVRAGERIVVRDGHGTGEGRGNSLGEAHDVALKGAETDATKRALVTFGKAFGLTLYSDRRCARQHEGAGAVLDVASPVRPTATRRETEVPSLTDGQNLGSINHDSSSGGPVSDEVGGSVPPAPSTQNGTGQTSGVPLLRLVDHSRERSDRQKRTYAKRTQADPRQGASTLRRISTVHPLCPLTCRRASPPLCPTQSVRQQGER